MCVVNNQSTKAYFMYGKIYYELDSKKMITSLTAIVRVNFPLDKVYLIKLIKKYNADKLLWVQEEPENIKTWSCL